MCLGVEHPWHMGKLAGPILMEKTEFPNARRLQLSTAPQLWVRLHKCLTGIHAGILSWLDLVQILFRGFAAAVSFWVQWPEDTFFSSPLQPPAFIIFCSLFWDVPWALALNIFKITGCGWSQTGEDRTGRKPQILYWECSCWKLSACLLISGWRFFCFFFLLKI